MASSWLDRGGNTLWQTWVLPRSDCSCQMHSFLCAPRNPTWSSTHKSPPNPVPLCLPPPLLQWEPDGFLQKIAGHACYDPVKVRHGAARHGTLWRLVGLRMVQLQLAKRCLAASLMGAAGGAGGNSLKGRPSGGAHASATAPSATAPSASVHALQKCAHARSHAQGMDVHPPPPPLLVHLHPPPGCRTWCFPA